MTEDLHAHLLSRGELLRLSLPQVLRTLELGSESDIDEGTLADLIALRWLRRDGDAWRTTDAGQEVCRQLRRAGRR